MIHLEILPQPDDVTCGPTSLHAVYNHWGHHIDLHTLIDQTPQLKDGGTLAVMLGLDALSRGFRTQLISYNLKILDPSWAGLDNLSIIQRLTTQIQAKPGKKFHEANRAYIKYLENGGEILWEDLTPELLKYILIQGKPILTGLSATYLYNCKREYTGHNDRSIYDDIRGTPMGHFVVLCGLTSEGSVQIADPYKENPISQDNYYQVDIHRLINAILLGIVTYDANMLILEPRG